MSIKLILQALSAGLQNALMILGVFYLMRVLFKIDMNDIRNLSTGAVFFVIGAIRIFLYGSKR